MKDTILAVIILFVVWILLFFSSILYLNSFQTLKKVIKFDLKEINKTEVWMSLFLSLIVSLLISLPFLNNG